AGGGNVTAAVELSAVEGADPVAEGRGDPGVAGQGPQIPAGAGAAAAAGGGGAAAAGTAVRLVLLVLLGLLLGKLLLPLGFLGLLLGLDLSLVGLFRLGDLVGDVVGVVLQLVHLLGVGVRLAVDLGDGG